MKHFRFLRSTAASKEHSDEHHPLFGLMSRNYSPEPCLENFVIKKLIIIITFDTFLQHQCAWADFPDGAADSDPRKELAPEV
jgi:hypothetical protein